MKCTVSANQNPQQGKSITTATAKALYVFCPCFSFLQSKQPKPSNFISLVSFSRLPVIFLWTLANLSITWSLLFQQLHKNFGADIKHICFIFDAIMPGYKRSRPQIMDGTFWSIHPDVCIFNYCISHRLPYTDLTEFRIFLFFFLLREVFAC